MLVLKPSMGICYRVAPLHLQHMQGWSDKRYEIKLPLSQRKKERERYDLNRHIHHALFVVFTKISYNTESFSTVILLRSKINRKLLI